MNFTEMWPAETRALTGSVLLKSSVFNLSPYFRLSHSINIQNYIHLCYILI